MQKIESTSFFMRSRRFLIEWIVVSHLTGFQTINKRKVPGARSTSGSANVWYAWGRKHGGIFIRIFAKTSLCSLPTYAEFRVRKSMICSGCIFLNITMESIIELSSLEFWNVYLYWGLWYNLKQFINYFSNNLRNFR